MCDVGFVLRFAKCEVCETARGMRGGIRIFSSRRRAEVRFVRGRRIICSSERERYARCCASVDAPGLHALHKSRSQHALQPAHQPKSTRSGAAGRNRPHRSVIPPMAPRRGAGGHAAPSDGRRRLRVGGEARGACGHAAPGQHALRMVSRDEERSERYNPLLDREEEPDVTPAMLGVTETSTPTSSMA